MLYLNRSAAYAMLNQFEKALEDGEKARRHGTDETFLWSFLFLRELMLVGGGITFRH